MKYIVELKRGKDIIDLCYAVKDVGRVIPTRVMEEAVSYIDREISGMPLNGCKIRLLELKNILGGGKND